MDTQMQALPPLKRFRLLQQQQQSQNHDKENVDPAWNNAVRCLPAKKRKESRHVSPFSETNCTTTTTTTIYCLPAKKRVWALPPEPTTPPKPFSDIDLNVAYNPCFDEIVKENRSDSSMEDNLIEKFESLGELEEKRALILVPGSNSAHRSVEKDEQEHREYPEKDAAKDDDRTEKSKCLGMKKAKGVSFTNSASGNTKKLESKPEQKEKGVPFSFPANGNEEKPVQVPDEGVVGSEEEDDGILCAICQSTDGDPKDPIVFCDGCDLMVHTTCYGNPLVKGVPEGDWFCNQCSVSRSRSKLKNASESESNDSLSCYLCPNRGGALKLTIDGSWAHIVCSLFVPEVFFEDPEGREGIDCSKVPKKRWERRCYICRCTNGCAIDCSEPKCPLAFHVTCGLKNDLCIEYQEGKKKGAIVAGFCKNHTEVWRKQEQTGKFKIVAREEHR